MTYEEFEAMLTRWHYEAVKSAIWAPDTNKDISATKAILQHQHVAMLAYVDSLRAELDELHRIPMPRDIEVNQ